MQAIARAATVLLQGGIVAYPTEGVYGLGCLPDDIAALERLVHIKQRDADKGFIVIAAETEQLEGWAENPELPDPDPMHPTTWIVAPGDKVTSLLTGTHSGLAVRLTTNPTARALCYAVDSPITSTSANLSGRPVARNRHVLRRRFRELVDYIVPGNCGPSSGPSEIRDFASGRVLRPRS